MSETQAQPASQAAPATITFLLVDGGITLLTRYEGGFDASNPTHQAASLLGAKMHELAEPASPLIDLSEAEMQAIQAGGSAAAIAAMHSGLVEPVDLSADALTAQDTEYTAPDGTKGVSRVWVPYRKPVQG